MSKHIVNGYITIKHSIYTKEPEIGFQMWKPSAEYAPDTVVVAEHQIEVEVPDDFDPRPGMVDSLKEQKKKEMARFALRVKEIDDRIHSLLAIEHVA